MDSSPAGWSGLELEILEDPLLAWKCCPRSQAISLKYNPSALTIQQLPRPWEEKVFSNPVPREIFLGTDPRGNV